MFQTIIPVSEINLADERYRISSDKEITFLCRSISEIGLVNPPVVEKEGDGYLVVSGVNRIRALMAMDREKIQAVVLDSDATESQAGEGAGAVHQNPLVQRSKGPSGKLLTFRALVVSISDNAFQRELDLFEQARGVWLLSHFLAVTEIVQRSGAIFNTGMNAKLVNKLLTLGAMPSRVHELVRNNRLSMTAALRLDRYDEKTMEGFLEIFDRIKTGLNKQMEIITNLHETALRDDTDLLDILNSEPIKAILYNETCDRSRKGTLLRALAAEMRFPALVAAKETFLGNAKALKMGEGIRLVPPADFESPTYTVSLEFSGMKELEQRVEKLGSLCTDPVMKEMLS